MEYKILSVNGVTYGLDRSMQDQDLVGKPVVTNVDFRDKNLFDALSNPSDKMYKPIVDNLFCIALCHTLITEEKNGEIIYNASSPDELALVNFAKFCGVEYRGMDENNVMSVKFEGKLFEYKLLYVLEFNSTRKRASVIL